jgi:AraC family transcriptional regulator, positive regulator of tynA and feaB
LKTIFSTRAVHPRDRFDFWYTVACRDLVMHDAVPASRQTFHANLRTGVLADLGLYLFEGSPMRVTHTARHAALTGMGDIFLFRQISGRLELEQEGRQATLQPGDFTLIDPSLPYTASVVGDSSIFLLKVPRRAMEVRLGRVRDVTACAVTSARGEQALTSAMLGMLPEQACGLGSVAGEMVREQMLDLVSVCLRGSAENLGARVTSSQALVLTRIRAAIDARIAEPLLAPCSVAEAAGVSVRYASTLLAKQGTSIGRLILERRLLKCRRALEDPTQVHRTVSEIAYGWGFSDMTHFGRKFRAAFGVLPSIYRRKGRPGDNPGPAEGDGRHELAEHASRTA